MAATRWLPHTMPPWRASTISTLDWVRPGQAGMPKWLGMAQLAQLNRMNPFGVNIGMVNLGAVGISLAGAAVLLQANSHSLGLVSVQASEVRWAAGRR